MPVYYFQIFILFCTINVIFSSSNEESTIKKSNDVEKCGEYLDTMAHIHPERECDSNEFCCGKCTLRFCCSYKELKLDQNYCKIISSEKFYFMVFVIFSSIVFVNMILVLVICCVNRNCLLRRNLQRNNRVTDNVQPMSYSNALKYSTKVDEASEEPPPYPGNQVTTISI